MTVIHVIYGLSAKRFGGADSGVKSSPYEQLTSHRISTPEHPEKIPPRRAGNPDRRRMKGEMQRPSRSTPHWMRSEKGPAAGEEREKTDCRETNNRRSIDVPEILSALRSRGIAPRWRALKTGGRTALLTRSANGFVETMTVQASIDQAACSCWCCFRTDGGYASVGIGKAPFEACDNWIARTVGISSPHLLTAVLWMPNASAIAFLEPKNLIASEVFMRR